MRLGSHGLLLLIGAMVASLAGGQDPYTDTVAADTQTTEEANSTTSTDDDMQETCASLFSPKFQEKSLINGTHLTVLLALPLTFEGSPVLSPGFFQLASALMAIDHFNQRNSCVVPELDSLQDCPIQLDYNTLQVMDTGTVKSNAMASIMDAIIQRELPHVIVGPYNEIPALELSVVAASMGIPMVSHRALDHNLLLPNKHPMVTQVNPDLYAEMDFLGDYLQHTGRTDYIAILYASSSDSAIQRLEAFRGVANQMGMLNLQAFGYVSPGVPIENIRPVQTVAQATQKLAKTGYRTIVWMTNDIDADLYQVGKAAHAHGLDNGDYFWVMGAALELDRPLSQEDLFQNQSAFVQQIMVALENGTNPFQDIVKMMQAMAAQASSSNQEETNNTTADDDEVFVEFLFNSAFLRQAELLDQSTWADSNFMKAWFQLNRTFFDRAQHYNPISTQQYQVEWERVILFSLFMGWLEPNQMPGLVFPPDDLFSNPKTFFSAPSSGSINLYDAIISVGLGACHAYNTTAIQRQRQYQPGGNLAKGQVLQAGIRSVNFQGASGPVQFGDGFPGSRARDSITYAVFNMFPDGNFTKPFQLTEYRNATNRTWHHVAPFVYANGSTNPPKLLRNEGDPNYLSDGVRIAGLSLAGVAYLAVVVSIVWIAVYRHHALVVASQPLFLMAMCGGCAMTTTGIVLISFDEGQGWSTEALTAACRAVPWVVSLGHIVTYNMLFTKLWRVNRVLQFSRRKVDIKHVIWPALLLEAVAFIVLSIWTATTSYGWTRDEIDEITGDTMGRCGPAGEQLGFWIATGTLAMIPALLTGIFAWKTIDVDSTYSEAKWIFALILVQCQVIVVGLPVVVILQDVSTDGRYLGVVLILWTIPITTIGLIMLPKMFAVHFSGGQRNTRGSSGGVHVTGVSVHVTGVTSTSTDHNTNRPTGSSAIDRSSLKSSAISHATVIQH